MADTSDFDRGASEPEDRGWYEFDLWVQLGTIVDLYAMAREDYWRGRLEAEDWTPLKQLREVADDAAVLIRKRAMALRNFGEASELNAIYHAYQHEREDARERAREQNTRLETSLRGAMP